MFRGGLPGLKDWTLESLLFPASSNGRTEVVKLLLDAGAKNMCKSLSIASKHGHADVVKMLLDAGADKDEGTDDPPLCAAAENGHSGAVRLLLDAGADTESANAEGLSPFCIATKNGHAEVVKMLLDARTAIPLKTQQR